jgi:hypothetical protein
MDFKADITTLTTNASKVTICPTSFLYDETKDICYCEAGYANISNYCVGCVTIGNSTGQQDAANSSRCQCKPTYLWDMENNVCLCAANSVVLASTGSCYSCSNIGNSSNLADVVNGVCDCLDTYVFAPTENKCRCSDDQAVIISNACVSCSSLANGTG